VSVEASLEQPLLFSLTQRLVAECLGTALLLAIVIGSGIMGERLAGGNTAIALLGNTVSTGAGLMVLIAILGPLSGAHFNPAVTLVFAVRRELSWPVAVAYIAVQVMGAVMGAWLAHAMFAEPLLQISTKNRSGWAQGLSEAVATFGLIGTILGSLRFRRQATPWLVGLYIVAAYWFTASTSFANPAVTLARSLSDTFAGIAPASVSLFIAAQLAGAMGALGLFGWLLDDRSTDDR
jgi:glycerol uptake facilitator-like aquaporin